MTAFNQKTGLGIEPGDCLIRNGRTLPDGSVFKERVMIVWTGPIRSGEIPYAGTTVPFPSYDELAQWRVGLLEPSALYTVEVE